ncbi:MAG TPA: HD domain-containing protein [Candidatus Saccharimonadales bacterium]|jgi:putative hydrolase of HD superfamily|nr:HD domain-containing protein [Candidatus Saccharimonadales bacterium]
MDIPTPTNKPAIKRIIELQSMLLVFHSIDRKVCIPPTIDKAENDIEHSFSLGMIAWFLAAYFPHLDANKLIKLSLAHDIVEVHAGDTFSYDKGATKSQKDREQQAVVRLKKEWADFSGMIEAILEYEDGKTEEAKFVYALDKLQPAIMDYLNEGRNWRRLGITFAKFIEEKEKKIPRSPEITEYYHELCSILEINLHLFPQS